MLKSRFLNLFLPVAVWLVLMSLIKWQWGFSLILFWLGGILGTLLSESDHVVYLLWTEPQQPTSIQFKALLQQKQYRQALNLVIQTAPERRRLPFHNVLLQAILIPFGFFVVTSSGSTLGIGMVMAIYLSLLVTQVVMLMKNQIDELGRLYFWPIQAELTVNERQWSILGLVFAFICLSLFIV
jgi:hypothetical protein